MTSSWDDASLGWLSPDKQLRQYGIPHGVISATKPEKAIYVNFAKKNDLHESMYSWWRHQMETVSALLALCAGNSPVPVNSPHKGQWRRALIFSLICVWINGWVNNREAGDLRRHRGHYDVNGMFLKLLLRTKVEIQVTLILKSRP